MPTPNEDYWSENSLIVASGILDSVEVLFDTMEGGRLDNELIPPGPIPIQPFDPFISCELLFESEGTPFDAHGNREFTQVYRVIVSSKDVGPVEVVQAPCIPSPFSPYVSPLGRASDLAARLVNTRAARELRDDFQCWLVTCRYSTSVPDGGIPLVPTLYPDVALGTQNEPWREPVSIEWDSEIDNEAPMYDLDGKAYVNSAGQPFTPAPIFPVSYPVLVITRNQRVFDHDTAARFSYAVNKDIFLNNPPGTCQSLPPRAKLEYRGSIPFYRVVYRVRIKTQTYPNPAGVELPPIRDIWQPTLLDAGLYAKSKIGTLGFAITLGTLVPIYRGGFPITHPALLNGSGGEAVPVAGVVPQYFLKFRRYPPRDLNPLLTSDNP